MFPRVPQPELAAQRAQRRQEIDAVVRTEAPVLGGDGGLLQDERNLRDGHGGARVMPING